MTNKFPKYPPEHCEKYTDSDFIRYVSAQMNEHDVHEFVEHAESCPSCLLKLRQTDANYFRAKDEDENAIILQKTFAQMDKLDSTLFTVVIRAVKGVVELVRSTGEQLLLPPILAGVRSENATGDSEDNHPVKLVKEFHESKFSVEVTISPVEPNMLDIVVSLLDLQSEEFISGAQVVCTGQKVNCQEITDVNGQVYFSLPASGFYELSFYRESKLMGQMSITGL